MPRAHAAAMRERTLVFLVFIVISSSLFMSEGRLEVEQAMAFSSNPVSTQRIRILCFGDSLTAGTAPPDTSLYPYAPHLESSLKERGHNVMVRHRGLPGWTASQMVQDANGATTGLLTAVRGGMPLKLVIILAGSNDLAYTDDPTLISDNIRALHKMCHGEGVPHTLAVGIPTSGYQSMNEEAASLARTVNDQLREYCQSESMASFVHFPFEFARDDEKWAYDGLHLSAEGYRVLGLSLAPVVEKLIIDSSSLM